MTDYKIITLRQQPEIKNAAAQWFSSKWGVPKEAYLDDGAWEAGYHIGGKYTKNGYATEAVKAFLPVIMKRIGIDKIAGICVAENVASQKVMEKCGFVCEFRGVDNYQGEQREICRYYYMLG